MKIAGMVAWVLTAGIGAYLLVTGIAAQRPVSAPAGGRAPRAAATPAAEGSPLLEFTHPLLALTGLMFWIFFVLTDDRLFAWVAFGIVVATVLAGLGWVSVTRRAGGRPGAGRRDAGQRGALGPGFPAHLVIIHGLAAACTFGLVVISAVTAAHG